MKLDSPTPDEAITREDLLRPDFLPTCAQVRQAMAGLDRLQDPIEWENQWSQLLIRNKIFEVFNSNYLNSIADYLVKRLTEIAPNKTTPVTILEIGAGNGRLSHFLGRMLNEKAPGKTRIIATDSYKDNIKPYFEVEKIDHISALQKYEPEIVICSWMPYEIDFTRAIRLSPNIQEYILIGETAEEWASCGKPWDTWGYSDPPKRKKPRYAKDGFVRINHDEWREQQNCQMDSSKDDYNSRTVSFVKIK